MDTKKIIMQIVKDEFEVAAAKFAANPVGDTWCPLVLAMWALQGAAQLKPEEIDVISAEVGVGRISLAIASRHRHGTPLSQPMTVSDFHDTRD